MTFWKIALREKFGGQGSGNYGHEGRPGEVGGSGQGGTLTSVEELDKKYDLKTPRGQRQAILHRLNEKGYEALIGKGGFFIRGMGHVPFDKARTIAELQDVKPERIQYEKAPAWGDMATIVAINRPGLKIGKE